LPVYRTYIRSFSIRSDERRYIVQALETARQRNPDLGSECFDFVGDVLLLREQGHVLPEQREARLAFVMRWQQFTGPIMAKGVEDCALYVYNRLISLNEVGGDPSSAGVTVAAFHEFLHHRQRHDRHTLNTTSTHDTKRAEDVRARINVLSELPDRWEKNLARWSRWNAPEKKLVNRRPVPDPNEEILLYQTMLGAWPLDEAELAGFTRRLQDYMVKATREAMVHTKWTRPNLRHEQALLHFIESITKPSESNVFLKDFQRFYGEIAYYGALNSLAQLLVKITAPGVPDFYQGSELWDLTLVDPDNRGPVDFEKRVRLLAELKLGAERDRCDFIPNLLGSWADGRIKLYLTFKALGFRRAHRELYLNGAYQPLPAAGPKKTHVFAFIRNTKRGSAVTAVTRLVTKLVPPGSPPIGKDLWASSVLLLSRKAPPDWINVLTGEPLRATVAKRGRELYLGDVFNTLPVALLASVE
jgi:(1->4)-alpha-D-glucan 1-alpha-D-glucosylmutase